MTDPTQSVQFGQSHQSIPLDESKRHFVFGDIHGRFATFERLLSLINYDPTTDVIYSVGDMIDRGPDSASVVKFFQQDHCHSVLGNHEQMAVNSVKSDSHWMGLVSGGSATMKSLEKHRFTKEWLVRICNELPICLDVGEETQTGAFRLIHAESPLIWNESELMSNLSSVTRFEAAEGKLLWGRDDIDRVQRSRQRFRKGSKIKVADGRSPRAVFCGHTPIRDVVSEFNVNWIDTYLGDKMTCIDPMSMKIFQQPIDSCDRY